MYLLSLFYQKTLELPLVFHRISNSQNRTDSDKANTEAIDGVFSTGLHVCQMQAGTL